LASLAGPGLIALAIVALDQVTKALVHLSVPAGVAIPVVGDYIRLVHVRNSGAAFGLFRDSGAPFVFISIAASVLVLLYLLVVPVRRILGRRALGFVLGGAVGNMIDRCMRSGEVIDFIEIGLGPRLRWPAFNVADIAVTVGVALLVMEFLWHPRRKLSAGDASSA